MVTIDGTIVLIAMPDIFRGIRLNPLLPGNSFYLLWMILGFLVVTSVLVVSLGPIGRHVRPGEDLQPGLRPVHVLLAAAHGDVDVGDGRRHLAHRACGSSKGWAGPWCSPTRRPSSPTPSPPTSGAWRSASTAVAATSGTFIGLVLGGLLAPINWRLIFLVSVPIGLFCTVWAYTMLHDLSPPRKTSIDWAGNVTFAAGPHLRDGRDHLRDRALPQPHHGVDEPGGHQRAQHRRRAADRLCRSSSGTPPSPCSACQLFRIRAFTAGVFASFLSAVGRGGLMFMLIIWLQGIWLPLHGYDFVRTPLWAGIYMLPLTVGFLIAGPISGVLSDRYGARPFATGGMLCTATSFFLLERLPVDFGYWTFAPLLLLMGLSNGLFMSPNRAGVMNSLPAEHRGAGVGHDDHLPELRPGAVDRDLLLAHDRRALRRAAGQHVPRARARGRLAQGGHAGRPPSPGVDPVRRAARVQPDAASPGTLGAGPPAGRAGRGPRGSVVLPPPHLDPVPPRACTPRSTSPSGLACSPPRPRGSAGGRYVYFESPATEAELVSADAVSEGAVAW